MTDKAAHTGYLATDRLSTPRHHRSLLQGVNHIVLIISSYETGKG